MGNMKWLYLTIFTCTFGPLNQQPEGAVLPSKVFVGAASNGFRLFFRQSQDK